MSLSGNKLSALPMQFSRLRYLQYLRLDNNDFEVFPEPLRSLPCLESLDISKNKLKALPSDFGKLMTLKVLNVSNNFISELPSFVAIMPYLKGLKLDNNPITFPPKHMVRPMPNTSMEDWIRTLQEYLSLAYNISLGDGFRDKVTKKKELLARRAGMSQGDSLKELPSLISSPTREEIEAKLPADECTPLSFFDPLDSRNRKRTSSNSIFSAQNLPTSVDDGIDGCVFRCNEYFRHFDEYSDCNDLSFECRNLIEASRNIIFSVTQLYKAIKQCLSGPEVSLVAEMTKYLDTPLTDTNRAICHLIYYTELLHRSLSSSAAPSYQLLSSSPTHVYHAFVKAFVDAISSSKRLIMGLQLQLSQLVDGNNSRFSKLLIHTWQASLNDISAASEIIRDLVIISCPSPTPLHSPYKFQHSSSLSFYQNIDGTDTTSGNTNNGHLRRSLESTITATQTVIKLLQASLKDLPAPASGSPSSSLEELVTDVGKMIQQVSEFIPTIATTFNIQSRVRSSTTSSTSSPSRPATPSASSVLPSSSSASNFSTSAAPSPNLNQAPSTSGVSLQKVANELILFNVKLTQAGKNLSEAVILNKNVLNALATLTKSTKELAGYVIGPKDKIDFGDRERSLSVLEKIGEKENATSLLRKNTR
ncbi:hypothetical protein BKA69DRAFT_1038418 [Paraphysoderma sedebokerense]|nr:hypothetical protein BKA69DRAFT_1038418 [Paraphysoderma sedebokerense]